MKSASRSSVIKRLDDEKILAVVDKIKRALQSEFYSDKNDALVAARKVLAKLMRERKAGAG